MKLLLVTRNNPEHFTVIDALQETNTLCGTIFQTDGTDDYINNDPIIEKYKEDEDAARRKFFGMKFSHASNMDTIAISGSEINSDKTINFINDKSPDIVMVFDTVKFTEESLAKIPCEKWNIHKGYIQEYRGYNCHFRANYDLKPSFVCCTIHKLIDTKNNGDIIHQTGVTIRKEDTVQDSSFRSIRTMANSLPALIEKAKTGQITSKPQGNNSKYYEISDLTPNSVREIYAKYGNRIARLVKEGKLEAIEPDLFRQI